MALIPQEPRQRNALLIGLVAAAAFYFFSTFWYGPKQLENVEAQERLDLLEAQNRRSRVVLAQGGANLEERLALYDRHLVRLEELIPESAEVPAFLNQIIDQSRSVGVIVRDFGPQNVDDPAITSYERLAYSIEVAGEYHDIGRFVSLIASLPRIMMVTDLTLVPLDLQNETHPDIVEMVAPVQANFSVETYVLRELAPPALGEEEIPGGAG